MHLFAKQKESKPEPKASFVSKLRRKARKTKADNEPVEQQADGEADFVWPYFTVERKTVAADEGSESSEDKENYVAGTDALVQPYLATIGAGRRRLSDLPRVGRLESVSSWLESHNVTAGGFDAVDASDEPQPIYAGLDAARGGFPPPPAEEEFPSPLSSPRGTPSPVSWCACCCSANSPDVHYACTDVTRRVITGRMHRTSTFGPPDNHDRHHQMLRSRMNSVGNGRYICPRSSKAACGANRSLHDVTHSAERTLDSIGNSPSASNNTMNSSLSLFNLTHASQNRDASADFHDSRGSYSPPPPPLPMRARSASTNVFLTRPPKSIGERISNLGQGAASFDRIERHPHRMEPTISLADLSLDQRPAYNQVDRRRHQMPRNPTNGDGRPGDRRPINAVLSPDAIGSTPKLFADNESDRTASNDSLDRVLAAASSVNQSCHELDMTRPRVRPVHAGTVSCPATGVEAIPRSVMEEPEDGGDLAGTDARRKEYIYFDFGSKAENHVKANKNSWWEVTRKNHDETPIRRSFL